MSESRTKKSMLNVSTALVSKIVGLASGFAERTVFIRILGVEYLGISGVFANILTLLSLAELGINGVILSVLYKPVAERDDERVKSILSIFRLVLFCIGAAVFFLGLCLLPFLPHLITSEINVPENIYLLYILFLSNSVAGYYVSYHRIIFVATQNQHIESIVTCVVNFAIRGLQILLLFLCKNYIIYLSLMPSIALVEGTILKLIFHKRLPQFTGKAPKLSKEDSSEISKRTRTSVLYRIGQLLIAATDNMIITIYISTTQVGVYSNYAYIVSMITSIVIIFTSGVGGSVGNAIATLNKSDVHHIFNRIIYVVFLLSGICAVGMYIFFNTFIQLWAGDSYLLPLSVVLFLCINFFISQNREVINTFKYASGTFMKFKYGPLLEAACNLILSIVLVQYLGLLGIILATTISAVCVSLWSEAFILHRFLFEKRIWGYFIKYSVFTLIFIFSAAISYFILLIPVLGIPGFIIKALLSAFSTAGIFILLTHKTEEFKYYFTLLISIVKKKEPRDLKKP